MKRLLIAGLLLYMCGALPIFAQPSSREERGHKFFGEDRLEKDVFKNVLRITQIRNLHSDNFPADLEIEFKNIGTKPIYHIYIVAVFPGSSADFGVIAGFPLYYGRPELLNEPPKKTDKPVMPGETGVITTNEEGRGTKPGMIDKVGTERTEKLLRQVEFIFQVISFGDGTRYSGSDYVDTGRRCISKFYGPSQLFPLPAMLLPATGKRNIQCDLCCDKWELFPRTDFPCNGVCIVNQVRHNASEQLRKPCYWTMPSGGALAVKMLC